MSLRYTLGGILAAGLFFFLSAALVSARELVFSEDFDGVDFAQWELVTVDDFWELIDGRAVGTAPYAGARSAIVIDEELWPDSEHLEVTLEYAPIEGYDRNFILGYNGPGDWYDIHFRSSAQLIIEKFKNGTRVWERWLHGGVPNGSIGQVRILMDGPQLTMSINDVVVIDEPDPSYEPGDWAPLGLRVAAGAVYPVKTAFDSIRVYRLDTTDAPDSLAVPHWKQNDPLWADEHYDTARDWSPDDPSLGRWGCALTSAGMIFAYHGLDTLPDGTELTPSTLNHWLTTAPDGYLGNGLINWQALARLSAEIAQNQPTPKLEYHGRAEYSAAAVQELIDQNAPPLIDTVGHFVVGTGVSVDQNQVPIDTHINDPFYPYTTLSEHTEHSESFSLRQFIPSQTDLSFLVVAAPEGWTLQARTTEADLTDFVGIQYQERIYPDPHSDPDTATQTRTSLLELPKPSASLYTLTAIAPEVGPPPTAFAQLQIYAYDSAGTLSQLSQLVSAQPGSEHQFDVFFAQNGASAIQRSQTNSSTLSSTLDWLQASDFLPYFVWHRLNDLVLHWGQAEPIHYQIYQQHMLDHLDWYRAFMDETVYGGLETMVWSHLDSNQGPHECESCALTN